MKPAPVHWEALLARAMTAEDPVAALRQASRDRRIDADTRRRLANADEDGIQMAALLITRLRFERLLRGSPEAERWFDENPESFTAAFKRYHRQIPPTAFFPREESLLFSRWIAAQSETRSNK